MKQSDFLARFNKKSFAIFSFSYVPDLISLRHVMMTLILDNVMTRGMLESQSVR